MAAVDRVHSGRRCRALGLLCILGALAPLLPARAGAQVAPDARWRTIRSEHFRVTFEPGLEALARHAAARAEAAWARYAVALAEPPRGTIDIVLGDNADFANGLATPFPSNRIVIYARPPAGHLALGNYRDWLDIAVVHELGHVFHLDETGRLGRVLRSIFGRVPLAWPFFPVIGTPQWSTEGLATYYESAFTGAGRVEGSFYEMIVRTAVLAGAFEDIDEASGFSPRWPAAMRSYAFGSLFLDHLAEVRGPEVMRALVRGTSATALPPALGLDRAAKAALGTSFTDAWRAWEAGLEARYTRLADSLRASGLTGSERLTADGWWALHPRVAPDGRRVAYAAADGRDDPAIVVIDAVTGERRRLGRLNVASLELGPASWLPDGDALVTAQFEHRGPYRLYRDLYRVGRGRERRLTDGARLAEPDAAPDGRRVVATQTGGGAVRLVVYDLETGALRPITDYEPGTSWALPRWSPGGRWIAVGRSRDGGEHDIVVLDTLGTVVRELGGGPGIDAAPAWSPDGRYIVFWSDRSGIPNLYAYDLDVEAGEAGAAAAGRIGPRAPTPGSAAPALRQVTNVLTGAFFPDVSPDGRWIYFSRYDADGFHIERLPFDPATWREPGPPRAATPGPLAPGSGGSAVAGFAPALPGSAGPSGTPAAAPVDPMAGPATPYSPFRSLLPRYWSPVLNVDSDLGDFYGAGTGGADLVGRHAYAVWAAVQPSTSRFEGALSYRYDGLANPTLGFEASRDWDIAGQTVLPGGARDGAIVDVLSREDVIGLSATLRRRRWRSAATLGAGIEHVTERLELADAPGYGLAGDGERNALIGVVARAGYGTSRAFPLSIGPEEGVSLSVTGRRRWDLDPSAQYDAGYTEATAHAAGYKGIRVSGFADHVLAARLSGLWQDGPGAGLSGIGGAAAAADASLLIGGGTPSLFLPIRGFPRNARRGTRAWTASLEYRVPLALIGRGIRLWPIFFDRLSGAAFVDAGDAWCGDETTWASLCGARDASPLIGAGAELWFDAGVLFSALVRLRGGVAYPVSRGDDRRPVYYLVVGPSF